LYSEYPLPMGVCGAQKENARNAKLRAELLALN